MCNLASHEFQSKTFGFGISVECIDCGEIFYAFFSESRAYKIEGWVRKNYEGAPRLHTGT